MPICKEKIVLNIVLLDIHAIEFCLRIEILVNPGSQGHEALLEMISSGMSYF